MTTDIGIEDQIPEDKMYLLRLVAHQYLGAKWQYYTRIKRSGKDLNLFKKASLLEQMKATQAALRFTSKAASKAYRAVYKECINDIRSNSEEGAKGFPTLPELLEGENPPALTPDLDAVIIEWTPLKFFLPCKQIRDKGSATERHTEGLATKLYFKVIGCYSTDENWNQQKLSLYLKKINKESTFQEVSNSLEPLKQDLLRFSESYNLFKFGQPILGREVSSEDTAFNDAMGQESPGSQVKTLYWQEFIYRGVELFLFRYYLTLISATDSSLAVKYLGVIFEPAIAKAIENKNIFIGSFDTDLSKIKFRIPYAKFKEQKDQTALKRRLKTKKGKYITYNYTQPLLDKIEVSLISLQKRI